MINTIFSKKKVSVIIPIIQLFFFILVALIVTNHTLAERGLKIPYLSSMSIHAICPFGGVESLYTYITTGAFVRMIHSSSLVLMLIVFILTLGFGAIFCGWICPLGTFQAFTSKIGNKLFKNKYNYIIPTKLDRKLRYLRYAVLLWILYITAVTSKLVFSDYCPYSALFNLWSGNIAIGGGIILFAIVLLSLISERPFCKYGCPYGALLGLGNRIRLFKLRRDSKLCSSCGICNSVCPMNIKISDKDIVKDHQCISCMKCTSQEACPIDNALAFTLNKKQPIPLNQLTIGIITFVLMFGGIALAINLYVWKTSSNRQPARFTKGEFIGEYNPADIRGSYTLGNTSEYFNIPLEDLAMAFDIPLEYAYNLRHGDLEEIYHELDDRGTEIGNGSVKLFVSFYTGLPYEMEEDTYLLEPAVDILMALGTLSEEQVLYIQNHKIYKSDYQELDFSLLLKPASEGEKKVVQGNTTFRDVIEWGVPQSEIETIIEGPLPNLSTRIQSYALDKGISFGKIKASLQQIIYTLD